MHRHIRDIHSRVRRIGAWASLAALLLIYAPISSATLMTVTGACCSGDQCPIHGSHHHAQNAKKNPVNCGHEAHNMSKMDACSMSCCQNAEQSVVHARIFVITPVSLAIAFAPLSSASFAFVAAKISRIFAPLAPPPKQQTS